MPPLKTLALGIVVVTAAGAAAWFGPSTRPSAIGESLIPAPVADAPDPVDALEASVRDAPSEYARVIAAATLAEISDPEILSALVPRFATANPFPAEELARDAALGRLATLGLERAIGLVRAQPAAIRPTMPEGIRHGLVIPDHAKPWVAALVLDEAFPPDRAAALLADLARGDQESVIAALRELAPASIRHAETVRLAALFVADSDAARAELEAIADQYERAKLVAELLPILAESTPGVAFELSLDIEHGFLKLPPPETIDNWLAADPAAAVARIFDPDLPVGWSHAREISAALVKHDPSLALEWAIKRGKSERYRPGVAGEVLGALGEIAPQVGADALRQIPDLLPDNIGNLTRNFVSAWAGKDPEKALAWSLEQEEGVRAAALRGYISSGLNSDTDALFAFFESGAVTGDERSDLLRHAAPLATRDLARFAKLAEHLSEDQSLSPLGSVAAELAQAGQFEGARAVVESVGIGEESVASATQKTVTLLALSDPGAARAWIDTFNDVETRASAARNLVDAWARQDPAAAAAYATTFPDGSPERAQVSFAMAERTITSNPEGAARWFANVTDPELRRDFIRDHLPSLALLPPTAVADIIGDESSLRTRFEHERAWQATLRGARYAEPAHGGAVR
ncbi:hypothetical protein BH23VER1_BH23VER1_37390 [soil metagenome]